MKVRNKSDKIRDRLRNIQNNTSSSGSSGGDMSRVEVKDKTRKGDWIRQLVILLKLK